eukprot:14018137-Alexandrium_andersonii.AAC.1
MGGVPPRWSTAALSAPRRRAAGGALAGTGGGVGPGKGAALRFAPNGEPPADASRVPWGGALH